MKFKYLKTFEAYDINNDQEPQMTSDKNSFNSLEKNLKEYNSKKTLVKTIYDTYKDDTELYNKLKTQRLIDTKSGINFLNPYLGLWAQACAVNRTYTDLDKQLNDDISRLETKNKELRNASAETREIINKEITDTNDSITDKKKKLQELKSEVLDIEKQTKDKLKQAEIDIKNQKKRIDNLDDNYGKPTSQ